MGNRRYNLEIAIQCYFATLLVCTREALPIPWATCQNNLGNAYRNRIKGDHAFNLEEAIKYYQNALQIYTREAFPFDWAMTNLNMGNVYRDRIKGDHAFNLEEAIKYFNNALLVYTREALPLDWATTQNNLAGVYCYRIKGDRGLNLEEAIKCLENALLVRTREAFPFDWAMTNLNMGEAYRNRIKGDHAFNLEEAIKYFNNALLVYTREALPLDWAMTNHNLANAYSDRIKGDHAFNLEEAIKYFNNALLVYTREALPILWAMTNHNMGLTYSQRIKGDHAFNLEEAIKYYQNALLVRTRKALPLDWAMTNNNLAAVYLERIKGNRAFNLKEAIKCLQNALLVYTREAFPIPWAMAQNNMGLTYSQRIEGDRAFNLEEAIKYYQNALQIYTRKAFPIPWATIENNMGLTYSQRIEGDHVFNLEEAIKCFQNALLVHTPIGLPLDCVKTGANLGNVAFQEGMWDLAIVGYSVAIEAVEISRSWSINDDRRQEIIQESIGIYANIIQCYVNIGKLDKALEYAEKSRSKQLVDLMVSNDLYSDGKIPPELEGLLHQYEDLQQQINIITFPQQQEKELVGATKLRQTNSSDSLEKVKKMVAELEAQKQQIRQEIRKFDPVLAGQIQVDSIAFNEMQKLINNCTTAVLSFYTTKNDTHIFILQKDKQPELFTCQELGFQALQRWIYDEWFIPYLNSYKEWRNKMGEFLQQISQRLQLNDLIRKHLSGIKDLIIVPHIFLHQIPFAALTLSESIFLSSTNDQETSFIRDSKGGDLLRLGGNAKGKSTKPKTQQETTTKYLGDKFRIRIVPSLQILNYCHQRPQIEEKLTGIVENATSDLYFTQYECHKVSELCEVEPEYRLTGRAATADKYKELLKEKEINQLHSSHHASFTPNDPLNSRLILADGALTLGQLISPGWRMPNLVDVFLSCCETNLSTPEITDDILTLGTGFLCAGARSVVSTLWAVDDLATSLFTTFYYEERKKCTNRSEALQNAQFRLRGLTGEELRKNYKEEMMLVIEEKLSTTVSQAGKDKLNELITNLELKCREDFPFDHPQYWSGFILQGMS